ncbi:MAG: GNAT family N-acetyltransferase [Kofleriaceae bacterium]
MTRDRDRLSFELVPFSRWRREISVLWHMTARSQFIGPMINGYGQVQYAGRELFERVLCFPWVASIDGSAVAWTSTFNVSDTVVRVRGIYVLPEYRSQGIGHRIVAHALAQWPAPWERALLYARASNVARYQRWGFERIPGHEPRVWAEGNAFGANEIVLMRKHLRAAPGT